MYALALLTLAFVAPGAEETMDREGRSLGDINRDIRQLFRAEAREETPAERARIIYDMTLLYREIQQHPLYETSGALQGYRAKLWSRLTRIRHDLENEFDLPHWTPDRAVRRGGVARPAPAPGPGRRFGQTGARDGSTQQDWFARTASASLSHHLQLAGATMGGAGRLIGTVADPSGGSAGNRGAAGGRAVPDYGPLLVDLIHATIAPDYWDINGGPGSIFYFAPLHALVVTATAEVHGQIGGALDGLRAAGN